MITLEAHGPVAQKILVDGEDTGMMVTLLGKKLGYTAPGLSFATMYRTAMDAAVAAVAKRNS